MRRKLRDPAGRAIYQRRKAIVEPVNGVLKEQRGMRRFRMKGLAKVAVEWTLASTAYNLTRLWRFNQPPQSPKKTADPRPLLLVALALKKLDLEESRLHTDSEAPPLRNLVWRRRGTDFSDGAYLPS